MIITCPHCQTNYQVAAEAIGAAGRQVQCANCRKAWAATPQRPVPTLVPASPPLTQPETPKLGAETERQLDEAFIAEERDAAPEAGPTGLPDHEETKITLDPALLRKQQRAFSRRQNTMARRLPLARIRRGARLTGVLLLIVLLVGGYAMRVDLVRQFPALADVYAGLGLKVNVVGLELRDIETVRTIEGGQDVLAVSVNIAAIADGPVPVPPVIVTLLDAAGTPLYEWSVTADVHDLQPGESAKLSTQLTAPPPGATQIRLGFGVGRMGPPTTPVTDAIAGEPEALPAAEQKAAIAHTEQASEPHSTEEHH